MRRTRGSSLRIPPRSPSLKVSARTRKQPASEPRADISILQASVVPRDAMVSKLADSDSARVGDTVFIVGAPYGLSHSLSAGILSARWEPDTITRDLRDATGFGGGRCAFAHPAATLATA